MKQTSIKTFGKQSGSSLSRSLSSNSQNLSRNNDLFWPNPFGMGKNGFGHEENCPNNARPNNIDSSNTSANRIRSHSFATTSPPRATITDFKQKDRGPLVKKRTMNNDSLPPQKSRKNKTVQLECLVQDGKKEYLTYLHSKIIAFYKLLTNNERFSLNLSNEDSNDLVLRQWLLSLGFEEDSEKFHLLHHYYVHDLMTCIQRYLPSELLNYTDASFTNIRCSTDDDDDVISQTPCCKSETLRCPDSTRSYINPSPSADALTNELVGLKVASKSPRAPTSQRPRSFTFSETTTSNYPQSDKDAVLMEHSHFNTTQPDIILFSKRGRDPEINELIECSAIGYEPLDPHKDIADDGSVNTVDTEEDPEERKDEFSSLSNRSIRQHSHETPDSSPNITSNVHVINVIPTKMRRSLTEPVHKKDRGDATPISLSQPTCMSTPITFIVDNDKFKKSIPASEAIIDRLMVKFHQRCNERKVNLKSKQQDYFDAVGDFPHKSKLFRTHSVPANLGGQLDKLRLDRCDGEASSSASLLRRECVDFEVQNASVASLIDEPHFPNVSNRRGVTGACHLGQSMFSFNGNDCSLLDDHNSLSYDNRVLNLHSDRDNIYECKEIHHMAIFDDGSNKRRDIKGRISNQWRCEENLLSSDKDLSGDELGGKCCSSGDKLKKRKKNNSFAKLKRLSLNFSGSCLLSTSITSSVLHNDGSGVDVGAVDATDLSRLSNISMCVGNQGILSTHFEHGRQSYSNLINGKIQDRFSISYRVCNEIDGHNADAKDASYLDGQSLYGNLNASDSYTNLSVKDSRKIPTVAADKFARIAVIQGGNFLYQFDNHIPVVAPPQMGDRRVINVDYVASDGSLTLEVLQATGIQDKCVSVTEHIQLGSSWRWYHCSPVGLLVTGHWISDQFKYSDAKKCIFYYLPKHPAKWRIFREDEGDVSVPSPVAVAGDESLHHIYHPHQEGCLMNCDESSIFDEEENDEVEFIINGNHALMDEEDIERSKVSFDHLTQATSNISHSTPFIVPQSIIFVIMSFLCPTEVRSHLVMVSKSWTLSAYWFLLKQPSMVTNVSRSDDVKDIERHSLSMPKLLDFLRRFPKGKFISEGACKRVFCIRSACGALNAVSIMDVHDMKIRGVLNAVEQELRISILCSNLSVMSICPNMIQVFSVFQTAVDPSKVVWKSKDFTTQMNRNNYQPKSYATNKFKNGYFQFIRMEYCNGGDVESLLRKVQVFDAVMIRSFLFQMCFALYCGREALSLRHFDLKLLNFFITSGTTSTLRVSKSYMGENEIPSINNWNDKSGLQIGFGRYVYTLPIYLDSSPSLIKLADFGTSAIGREELNEPITPHQFTTLENCPPEFLLLGSTARQSHTADTFCLGLCFVHMLTGDEPYEILLKDVLCPKTLLNKLHNVWQISKSRDESNPYSVIQEVVDTLEEVDEDDSDFPPVKEVLAHTFYRYLVMFAASPDFLTSFVDNELYRRNGVWNAVNEELDLHKIITDLVTNNGKYCTGNLRSNSNKQDPKRSFEEHVRKWSIHQGTSAHMQRLRENLRKLGNGSEDLLNSMLNWDPSQRCSMYDALHHPIFHVFREESKPVQSSVWSRYMYYYRQGLEGCDGLPIF